MATAKMSASPADTKNTSTKGILFWALVFTTHTLASLWIAWAVLAKMDFGYALGYSLIDSQAHIAEYAPQNLYKEGFGATTPDDHIALFGQINRAVHAQGEGLRDITYTRADGSRETLLHNDEIVHLQDVANLIDNIYGLGIAAVVVWIALICYARKRHLTPPAPLAIVAGFAGGTLLLIGTILAIGAKDVFYWAHTVVFPEDHPWFFYYEESLMTTLMKAPDLFAFIAVLLSALAVLIWQAQFTLMRKLLKDQRPLQLVNTQ